MATSEESDNITATPGEDEVMDTSESQVHKLKLADLKVTDLKVELERRELDKTGVKSVLVERLKNALLETGEDPEEFNFASNSDTKSPLKKKKIPDCETNGGVDTKEKDAENEINKVTDSTNEVTESINEITDSTIEVTDTTNEVTDSPNEVTDSPHEITDSPNEVTDSTDEVKEETSGEVKETSICSEDKNINEVTLQLSIDEEDAQLNEDEAMEISKVSDNESDIKTDEAINATNNESGKETAESEEASNVKSSPSKTLKTAEEAKEKKVTKTAAPAKTTEVSTAVSPKVLKVIGKSDKVKNASVLAKSLWITGLPNTTRAADLKSLFGKQGRVLSVKIVKSTKQTPGKCYGFVTMASSKDATKAIQNLHRTEFNERTISVERTQSEPSALLKKSESRQVVLSTRKVSVKKEVTKTVESTKSTTESKATTKAEAKPTEVKSVETPAKAKEDKSKPKDKSKSKERDQKSRERRDKDSSRRTSEKKTPTHRSRPVNTFTERPRFGTNRRSFGSRPLLGRSRFRNSSFRPRQEVSVYERMREERIRRDRIRDRERREAERRRLEELDHHKFIERRQREEAYRLEREKEKLRIERELLERERAEMLKMEREKQRLERERLEREREELRRVAELRQVVTPAAAKRPFARSTREADVFLDYRKKPSPRFEERSAYTEKARMEPATRYEFPTRTSFGRSEYDRRPTERFPPAKAMASAPRADFGDRDSRREVTMRSREERPALDFRDRDTRRSFPARERPSTSRRETTRDHWKQDRRVHDRTTASTSGVQRKTNYY